MTRRSRKAREVKLPHAEPVQILAERLTRKDGRRKKIPAELAQRQYEFVAGGLMQYATDRQMLAQARALNLWLSHSRLKVLKVRIRAEWQQQSDESLKSQKYAQIQRISRRMRLLENRLATEPGNVAVHRALCKIEEQLAMLQGTNAPIKVDVDLRINQAIVGVIANLSPEQVQEMYERRMLLEKQAEEAKHLLTSHAAE